jgi:dTDP-4-dehydrorhamnose reductase
METLEELGAWLVLDARGRDDVEASPSACGAPLAAACRRAGVRFAAFSSARVFGEAARGRLESHPPAPSTRAGRCEVAYERLVADACPEALLLRVGPLFGDAALDPGVGAALQRLRRGDPVALAAGRSITPSCADEVARWAVDLAIGDTRGVVHLVNAGGPVDATTWLDELAQAVGVGAPAGAIARARAGAANLELEAQGCLSSERVPALSDRAEALRRLTADLGRRRDGAAA